MDNAALAWVIVNGDDLGMSLAVNDAIFRAFDEGLLSSATVLVHGPGFADAVQRLRGRPGLRVGLHLDTTEFSPPGVRFAERWLEQVQRAQDAGIPLSHVDSHHHIHLQWGSLAALRRVCVQTGIRAVRGRSLDYGLALRSRLWRGVVGTFAAMPAHFLTIEHLLAVASAQGSDPAAVLGRRGWTEVMVHPGNPSNARYEAEMQALRRLRPRWRIGNFADISR